MPEKTLIHLIEQATPMAADDTMPDFESYSNHPIVEGDESPMFITLRLLPRGAKSRNDRYYPPEEIDRVADQINARPGRVFAKKGHVYDFQTPTIYWMSAKYDENKTMLWGKGYIPKTEEGFREYVRIAKRMNAEIGTSIWGYAYTDEDGRIRELEISRIDVVDAGETGIPEATTMPHLSTESVSVANQEADAGETIEDIEEMGPKVEDETQKVEAAEFQPSVNADAVVSRKAYDEAIAEGMEARREREALQKENAQFRAQIESVRELGYEGDIVTVIETLQNERDEYAREVEGLIESDIERAVQEAVAIEHLRPLIIEQVTSQNPRVRKDVRTALEAVMAKESVKRALQSAVVTESGPAQTDSPVYEDRTNKTDQFNPYDV